MSVKIVKESYKNYGDCLKISNNICEVIITVDVGPRIIGYNLLGKENVFYNDIDRNYCNKGEDYDKYYYPGAEWNIYGGHRLWISPEAEVKSYYPDNDPVNYDIIENGVRLNCDAQKGNNVQYTITVTLSEDTTKLKINHQIKNTGNETKTFAPWCLSVMASGGVGITPMPMTKTGLLANRVLSLWDYSKMNDDRVYWGDKYIILKHDNKPPFKYGIKMTDDWAAYLVSEQLFVKRFYTEPNGNYTDFGVSFESYTCAAFHEVESLGVLSDVEPTESVEHSEEWELSKCETKIADIRNESTIDEIVNTHIK